MSLAAEQVRWFSYARQRLNRAGRDPDAVLRDVVAVHAAHPTAPLSLLARCDPLTPRRYRELDALRLPAMRAAIRLLPRETAHLAFAAVPPPPDVETDAREQLDLSSERYAELRAHVLACAREPVTARELREQVAFERPLGPLLTALTREGALLRLGAHGLRSNELFFVAAHVPEADADEALAWLAGEYLRAYGPARRIDFAWWAGVPSDRADRALATHAVEVLDDGLLLPCEDAAAFEGAAAVTDAVDLLPRSDAYLMGYAPDGRGRLAARDVVEELYDETGESRPVVLVDGHAVGTWGVRRGSDLDFELELFESPSPSVRRALDHRAAAIRALLS